MSGPEVTSAIHALGFSAGIILYGMLLVMVGQVRPRSTGRHESRGVSAAPVDRLLAGTAVAGVLWNAGALWIYAVRDFGLPAPAVLQVVSFSALGFLPAFAVHAVARHEPGHRPQSGARLLTAAGYALSATAAALQAWAAATGATVPSVAALRLLTAGFVLLVVPLAVLTRRQAGARRLLWVLALAVFAVTSLHLAEHHLHDRWFMELAGHHGSLLLAFAVLYQDYPFALADLFLKRALAIGGLLLMVFGEWALLSPLVAGPSARPTGVPLLLAAWVATALAFPLVKRAASQLVDRLLLRTVDYHDTVAQLGQAVGALDDEDLVLDQACDLVLPALGAVHVRWARNDFEGGAATRGELVAVDPRRLSATVIIPTTEPPRYALDVSDVAGGRRLLSDEVSLLEHVGYVLGRRLDAIRLERERLARRLREEEISRREAEARLEALRAQINPHFLFNTLTTIGYLVQTSPAEAIRTLLRLTEVLRRVLRSDEHVAPLEQELRLVRAYLEIEQARFEERLDVRIDVPSDLLPALVPPLILQPLVENAVKHGVSSRAAGGTVTVSGRRLIGLNGEASLELTVRDQARGSEPSIEADIGSGGIGLTNIERRLALAYGERASVSLEALPDGAIARVRLPLELPAVEAAHLAAGGRA